MLSDHLKQHAIPYVITGAIALVVGWFVWSFDHLVDDRITLYYENNGVSQTDKQEILGQIGIIDTKIEALADKDDVLADQLKEMNANLRTLILALPDDL